jgi:outer membrane protein assembly factor BamB
MSPLRCRWWLGPGGMMALVLLQASLLADAVEQAGSILQRVGKGPGYCLVLGAPDAALPIALAQRSSWTLYVQVHSGAELSAVRQAAEAHGLLGTRIYAAQGSWDRLHLADNLADAVVVTLSAAPHEQRLAAEITRVLHPGGVALAGRRQYVKPLPTGYDDWTHPYHGPDNNPQSRDTVARAPYWTHFLAEPWYCPMPEVTVTAGGRMFKAFGHIALKEREWPLLNKLVAFNAYNGVRLWERDLSPGYMIHRNTIVATPELLYLADDKSCQRIDAATGTLRDEIVVPADVARESSWKWMALVDGVLYALVGEKEPPDETIRGSRRQPGWPWNGLGSMYDPRSPYRWGFGNTLLAIDPESKRVLWSHTEAEPIDGRAVCMNRSKIFFYCHPKLVGAVDRRTGAVAWRTRDPQLLAAIGEHDPAQNPRQGFSSTSYVKCSEEALFFAGPQRPKLVAVAAADGQLLWEYAGTLAEGNRIAAHGNFLLVLRDDGLYAMGRTHESKKFNPLTGEILATLPCLRGNCTRATGTVDAIFSRGHPHTGTLRLDLSGSEADPIRIGLMRPACQDGVVVSNGLLYWGPWMCDCNLQLVGMISLAPAGDFAFDAPADTAERLTTHTSGPPSALQASPSDWPAYRRDNARQSHTPARIRRHAGLLWHYEPPAAALPAAPIAVAGRVYVSGADGAIRCLDAASGKVQWSVYTSGPLKYPPAVEGGRLFAGSCDGWVYAWDAATGAPLWQFRAAPLPRVIPVYGSLSSTWPVASGVLVAGGTVYAAAGIASYDGTHVYALDAASGRIRWQNNSSGNLTGKEGRVTGVSVQGHLLLHGDKLYLAGGNVLSPAVFSATDGKLLSQLDDEWQKAPRGRELFLVGDTVRVFDRLLYSPTEYYQGRYFSQDAFVQAGSGDTLVRGVPGRLVRIDARSATAEQPAPLWESAHLATIAALAVTDAAVVATGRAGSETGDPVVAAFNLDDGQLLWSHKLPAEATSWGLCVDAQGRIVVTLLDGRVVCFQ